jgi:outer membrane protein TolC
MIIMKKSISILLLILFVSFQSFGQEKLILDSCRSQAKQNYPKLKQVDLLQKINDLKEKNNQSVYLPQIDLKGQATYQSAVTEINIPIPGIQMPSMSKDQYKLYLDLKQTIWDGGISKTKNELEKASLETDMQKLEVEAYQLNGLVDAYFFNLMIIRQNEQVLSSQIEVLGQQITKLDNAFKQGAARQKDYEKLLAERIMMQQKQIELVSKRESVIDVLSVITGEKLNPNAEPQLPESKILDKGMKNRPEYKLFELQQKQLFASDQLLTSSRNPMFFGFGQAGYGRPGLNMLSNNFDSYYMVGVGLSWRVIDWQNSIRNKKINGYQREVIGTIQSDFEQKLQMQLADATKQISNLKQLIVSDEELVDLRKKISIQAASELENGVVTSADYLNDLNAETVARINYETHKIQLVQATLNYNNILGK